MSVQPAPSGCVCTTLRMASRAVTRHYDHALAPLGLRTNDYSILALIDREGPLPLGVVAARLAMDRTTLSRETRSLIAAGKLEARGDASDGRRRMLSLSPDGATCVRRARPLWARAQQALIEEFGAGRTTGLVAELHALVGARE